MVYKDVAYAEPSLEQVPILVDPTYSLTLLPPTATNLIPWPFLLVTLRTMCDNAWKWAKERGKWRINPVHKEEEARIVIDDEFKYNTHQGHSSEQTGSFEMEVGVLSW